MENRPAARRGSVQGSPKLKAVLSVFWAIFHTGNSHFRANRGGAARCEQPGVRGVARGGARAQRRGLIHPPAAMQLVCLSRGKRVKSLASTPLERVLAIWTHTLS